MVCNRGGVQDINSPKPRPSAHWNFTCLHILAKVTGLRETRRQRPVRPKSGLRNYMNGRSGQPWCGGAETRLRLRL